ncbi:hypothetical protein [Brochothrix campestris]|uniref:Bacterial Ig domain-containing protein n=1 Tax=Brochothrix campestris FSL F6-1037 TaxID=1265861 RepID=W7CIB1_9LIST|nr:hypothetical protein [Brochothrix campestris]EUJ36707.1 hypothetical protein BCAMP_10545 [Brochothrix campestris FSL F6-1037]
MTQSQMLHPALVKMILFSGHQKKLASKMRLPLFLSGSQLEISQTYSTVSEIDNYQIVFKESALLTLEFDTIDSTFEGVVNLYNTQTSEVVSRNIFQNVSAQQLKVSVTPGRYDIEVKATSDGYYALSSRPLISEYDNNNMVKLNELDLAKTKRHVKSSASDKGKQLYRFSVSDSGALRLAIKADSALIVTLYTNELVTQAVTFCEVLDVPLTTSYLLEQGTYYLEILEACSHNLSAYTLCTTFEKTANVKSIKPPPPTIKPLFNGMTNIKGVGEPLRQIKLELDETTYNSRTDQKGFFEIKTPVLRTNQPVKVFAYAVNGIRSDVVALLVAKSGILALESNE